MKIMPGCVCGCEFIPISPALQTLFLSLRLGTISAVVRETPVDEARCAHALTCSDREHGVCVICAHTFPVSPDYANVLGIGAA